MQFLNHNCLLLDGGMASQLVSNGFTEVDEDPLWSARLLASNRSAIRGKAFYRPFLIIKSKQHFYSFWPFAFCDYFGDGFLSLLGLLHGKTKKKQGKRKGSSSIKKKGTR